MRAAVVALVIGSTVLAGGAEALRATAIFPSGAEFRLEVAADSESRRLGYMYREQIGPREGMLFLFEETAPHGFWMKNCKVSLDLIWLDEAFRIVQIAYDQPPCPEEGECPVLVPLKAARYVVEIAGGTAEREGLEAGNRLVILTEPPLR